MPGDGLALAVGVGGQVDGLGALGCPLDLLDHLRLALGNLVGGGEIALDINSQLVRGQVAHVAH